MSPAVSPRRVGLVLGSAMPPERLAPVVRSVEASGFDRVWLAEDFFFTGGVSGAAIVLAASERLTVGLGVVSAMVRHPALLAMEIATLARSFPGRLVPGIGLGVPDWLRQMRLLPESPLTALRECVGIVRRLLAGETVSSNGEVFSVSDVRLSHPPAEPVPLHLGVIGPRMLRLSGAVADGSILSVCAGADYVRWARGVIDTGRRQAGAPSGHEVTTFTLYSVGEDGEAAREEMRRTLAFYLAAGGPNALTDAAGISTELVALLDRHGPENLHEAMPDPWVDRLAVAGDPGEAVAGIQRLLDAGADSVALFPVPPDEAGSMIEQTAEDVIPLL